jgi:UDPglucose 6-dehydrogenase
MKVLVFGLGYVGLSLSVLFSQKNEVKSIDIVKEKVDLVNSRKSPIKDEYIEKFLTKRSTQLQAYLECEKWLDWPDYVVIATPTNYDPATNHFDTSSITNVLDKLQHAKNPKQFVVVIKSTIPIGFTREMSEKYPSLTIVFSPEFLREGRALYDNLHPTRIVVGCDSEDPRIKERAYEFGLLLNSCAAEETSILAMGTKEAEAVKLFANTYLATRVSFFNELDEYAECKKLDSSSIIAGVCMDPRIGNFYNNPSFGYGGYCLPKDTKQLLSEFDGMKTDIIQATVKANETRAAYIAQRVYQKATIVSEKPVIGIYRLIMKANSDNFRSSAIQNVIHELKKKECKMLIFEPTLKTEDFEGIRVTGDLKEFIGSSTVIIVNRKDTVSDSIPAEKIYSRDIDRDN